MSVYVRESDMGTRTARMTVVNIRIVARCSKYTGALIFKNFETVGATAAGMG
jgi:hypothetical protein